VLDRVKTIRRYAWVLLSQNAHVKAVDGKVLTIGMVNAGARDSFTRSGADEILRQALIDELGVDWRVEAIVDAEMAPPMRAVRERPSPPAQPGQSQELDDASETVGPPEWAVGASQPVQSAVASSRASRTAEAEAAKSAVRPMRASSKPKRDDAFEEAEVAADDAVLDDEALTDQELLARELGAEVIEDIKHESG
jgi:DNA polymerase-3 subunit gamma/tau